LVDEQATHVVGDEQTPQFVGQAPHEPALVAYPDQQTAHDDVPFWMKQFVIALVPDGKVKHNPVMFKAKPDPQTPDVHAAPAAQAVTAPAFETVYPDAAVAHTVADVYVAQPVIGVTQAPATKTNPEAQY